MERVASVGAGGSLAGHVEAVVGQLRQLLARVICRPPEQVPVDCGIDQLGVDSLRVAEFQALVRKELGTPLAAADLVSGPNLTQLAALLLREATPAGGPPAAESPAESTPPRNGRHHPGGPSHARLELFPECRHLLRRIDNHLATGAEVPYFRVQEPVGGPVAVVSGAERLNFGGYNYLGLCGHPRVNRAAQEAITRYGTSVSASRMVSGERPLHRQLEAGLAQFLGTEDALVFVSGYLTNVTVIGHLLGPTDAVFHDALVHNSALTGCKLSGARTFAFAHNDADHLARLLGEHRGEFRRALVVLEGVYSMDGDFPDLPRFLELKRRHDAVLMVDEAHSLGVLGRTGRGIAEHFGVAAADVDLWMGTLSKTLASCGGYLAGSRAAMMWLRITTPGMLYSVGLSPPDTAAALAALEVLREEPQRVALLRERAELFLRLARERGLDTGTSGGTAVVPVIVRDGDKAMALSRALFDRGIDAAPVFFPAVKKNAARLRFFITCLHSEAQLRATADAVAEEWAKLRSQG